MRVRAAYLTMLMVVVTACTGPSDSSQTIPADALRLVARMDTEQVVTPKGKPWRPPKEIADVHLGEPGKFGAVVVRLCGPCDPAEMHGEAKVKRDLVDAIEAEGTWVTLVIDGYPNGVVRGQLEVEG